MKKITEIFLFCTLVALIAFVYMPVLAVETIVCGNGICEGNENDAHQECTTSTNPVCYAVKNCAQDCGDRDCLEEGESGIFGTDSCCEGLKQEELQTQSVGSSPRIVCTKLAEQCKKENEQCGYSFGKEVGECCEGLECKLESNVPDAAAKCVRKNTSIVGGDKDEHGCIGSAGYSWCELKQKCLRSWEESCLNEKVKILPETASETAREKLGDLGFDVQ